MGSWRLAWDVLIRAGVGLLVVYAVYRLLLAKQADFTIRVRRGTVEYKGKFPLAMQQPLTQLLLEDLMLKRSVKIMGVWDRRRLRLWFRGSLSPGQRQRIRNFLTCLGSA